MKQTNQEHIVTFSETLMALIEKFYSESKFTNLLFQKLRAGQINKDNVSQLLIGIKYLISHTPIHLKLAHEKSLKLQYFPFLTKYFQDKKTSIKKLKLTFLLLPSERKILTESDILFLKPISEIISWIQRKKKNKIHLILDRFATDQLTSMAMVDLNFRKLIVKILQPKANYLFNGGLLFLPGVISKKELGVLEKSCKLFYEIGYIYNPYCEELLLSLLTNTDKDTALDPRLHATVWSYQHYRTINNPALIHYASDTKNILESDVVKQKLKKIFRIS
jgi:hypothetical protein